jgi:hypothetical protein
MVCAFDCKELAELTTIGLSEHLADAERVIAGGKYSKRDSFIIYYHIILSLMDDLSLSARAYLYIKRNLALPMNRWYHTNYGQWEYNENGVDLFGADWDNLYILDACRYDIFEKIQNLPGELSSQESRGSTTPEFLRANITGKDLRDTVYVTAQPQIHNHDDIDHSFYRVIDVWEEDWDVELGTVLPEDVAERAIEVAEQYPNKRLLVHFMQPHYPFIGETGRRRFNYNKTGVGPQTRDGGSEKFWDTVGTKINDVPEAVIWKAYEENLRLVLTHVERLLTDINGRSIVTSDHGEMIYEHAWPVPVITNGHPGQLYVPELTRVPWHVYTNGDRREITTGSQLADKASDFDDKSIKNRLEDLGYG